MQPSSLVEATLSSIRLNPVALRDVNPDSQDFQELVDSIKAEGVITPISIRRVTESEKGDDGKLYILVDGLQRYSASAVAGKETIPAQVLDRTEAESLVTQIIANAHKIETKPVDYAKSIVRILGYNPTMTEAQLAVKLNKSPTWLSKILKLNKLSDAAKTLVNEGAICIANGVAMTSLPDEEQQDWLDRAQTTSNSEFGPAVQKRAKEIRDAHRKGENAGEEVFTPIAHLRGKKELEAELESPTVFAALVSETETEDTAAAGFKLGIQWALNLDPKSVQIQKDKDTARRTKAAEDKARRDAERAEKRAKIAEENTAKAREIADKAKASLTQDEPVLAA